MVLQNILFPDLDTCERQKMFFKGDGVVVYRHNNYCVLSQGKVLSLNTYFNSFSVGKWNKYTKLNKLLVKIHAKGEFLVRMHHAEKILNKVVDKIIDERKITLEEKGETEFWVDINHAAGIYFYTIVALSEQVEFFGGTYETAEDIIFNDVKIAIGICTFKREEYVKHNLNMLKKHILDNENSPMHNKLDIFVSDNGQTLVNDFDSEHIRIFPNRNLGGAGGFTRAMLEIKKSNKECGFSHFILMDDDIKISVESILRTYAILCLLKPEYKDAFVGGHMLRTDKTHIQTEAADHWNIVGQHAVKPKYNLEKMEFLIKNEVEDSVNYLSWWYCCMPMNVVNDNNLPLPIFIKRDDIEYGLRNGKYFITMNGICVWHEPFEYKAASYLEYYYFRNLCIMNARHRISFGKERLSKEMQKRVVSSLLRYRYKDAELCMLGVLHYLNGIDWFKKQDAAKLHKTIMSMGYSKQKVEELDFVFVHGLYEKNIAPKKSAKGKRNRKYTLNGWLIPAKKNIIVPAYQPSTYLFFRAKKVLNYEEVSNCGFITERNYRDLFKMLKMLRRTKRCIKKRYDIVTKEYRSRYNELTNIEFWKNYLFNEGEETIVESVLQKPKRPKNTKNQYKEILVSYALRFLQMLLLLLPVKKNRVMVYVHDRKGFTCNPKYIVKELKKRYGEKIEIIWSTMYPETCKELNELNVTVIKNNTYKHFLKYLRTKFFITNDSFPSWAMRRPNQKWMNTWHGAINYKHIGYDYLVTMSVLGEKLFRLKNRTPNYFLSGTEFFTEDTSKSFRYGKDIFVCSGLPRNDLMVAKDYRIDEKVRRYYNIASNKRLVMFAPTFRRGMQSDTYGLDFGALCKALSEKFGGEWVTLFRNHNFVKNKQAYYNGAIDVSDYHDMQELLMAADVLISDYSSCLYDFSLSNKPGFVYAPDLDNYLNNDRSFALPIEKWPYPVAISNEELSKCILDFDEKTYKEKLQNHFSEVGRFDKGNAAEQVADIIAEICL